MGSHVAQAQARENQKVAATIQFHFESSGFLPAQCIRMAGRGAGAQEPRLEDELKLQGQMSIENQTMRFSAMSNISIFQGQFDPKWKHISSNIKVRLNDRELL